MEAKDVGPRIVPHDIKVELPPRNFSHVQVRRQDTFARKVGTGEHLPKGIDNTTATTRNDGLWLITKCCLVDIRVIGTTGELVTGQDKTATFQGNMLHGRNPSIPPIRSRGAVDLDALRIHRHAQQGHIILPTNHGAQSSKRGIKYRERRSVAKAPDETF